MFLRMLVLCGALAGCSGIEQSEQEKIRKANLKVEPILRYDDEVSCEIHKPAHYVREPYKWERVLVGGYPKITKEYFRCKGSMRNPIRIIQGGVIPLFRDDCGGYDKHSLPVKDEKEFIYPILIDLLNYAQEKLHKKVVITCGHQCPTHNLYAASHTGAKHLIGAEVDFYVEGLQEQPEMIVKVLMQYYEERYQSQAEYSQFQRGAHARSKTNSWYNKEVSFTLYHKNEGRDLDNDHGYPYISIEVRYDSKTQKKVICRLDEATRSYLRW